MTSKAFGLAQLGNAYSDGALSSRNRIINGAMTIDQRNAGAATTSLGGYSLDRWNTEFGSTGVSASFQQVADAPTGFVNSLKVTVTTAPVSVANSAAITQPIEGFNTSDFSWGSGAAKTITFSFWVKSSLTGSFGGSLTNNAFDQTYPFSYAINAANTWEYKTVVVEGPTSGTWLTTNATGIKIIFGLGAEAARKATAGVWANTVARQPTGSINLVETNGATWQITGVQLEAGDTATPFEHRSYGQELALCQRYYEKSYNQGTVPGSITENNLGLAFGTHSAAGNGNGYTLTFAVAKRATPTVTLYSTATGAAGFRRKFAGDTPTSASGLTERGFSGAGGEWTAGEIYYYHFTAAAEL
jgi:hypothetical protein